MRARSRLARGLWRAAAVALPLVAAACGSGEAPPGPTRAAERAAPAEASPQSAAPSAEAAQASAPGGMASRGFDPSRVRLAPAMREEVPNMEDVLARLASADPFDREEAVYALAPEGEALRRLAATATADPDAAVRRAAVAQLATGAGAAVGHALAAALADPDPDVVEEALNGLESVGDARAIPHLERLLESAHGELRLRVQDVIARLSR